MSANDPRAPSFLVADWEVFPEQNRLVREGRSISIEPKVMMVLELLANHPGAVVSREDLQRTAWRGVFVSDGALNRCINQLRKVLGDDAHEPRFIETISKRGYRLIARVDRGEGEATFLREDRRADVNLNIESSGLLGHRATATLRGVPSSHWKAAAERLASGFASAEHLDGRLVLWWRGTQLRVEGPRSQAEQGHDSTVIHLRTRSLAAASPLLASLAGLVLALLAVFGNGMRWSFAAAIVLAAAVAGSLAGLPFRQGALASGREAMAEFLEGVTARIPVS